MDTSKFHAESEIVGEYPEEGDLLRKMAKDARGYIDSFRWSPGVKELYLAYGIGGVVGVFLAELSEVVGPQEDRYLWIIQGDLPSAYLVTDDKNGPKDALSAYCDLMDDWVTTVRSGGNLDEVFPVAAQAIQCNAELLERRIQFIRTKVLPDMRI